MSVLCRSVVATKWQFKMESLKLVVCNRLRELDKKCNKYLLYAKDDEFLLRFKDCYDKVFHWDDETEGTHSDLMQTFARAVLDITFYEESRLVDNNFSTPDAKDKMQAIIDELTSIETLCLEYTDKPQSLLKEDMVECLLWRRGALCYMYCATMQENKDQRDADIQYFIKCLDTGIRYLDLMLSIRKPLLAPASKVDYSDEDTYFLLSEGVFSNNTLLGLMYAGELCFWLQQVQATGDTCDTDPSLDAVQMGRKFLKRYIRATEGPLKGKGWNSTKARELLAVF